MITLTEKAARKLLQLANDSGKEPILRVYVEGGGCSGFSYGMKMGDQINETDIECEEQFGVKVVVDPMSAMYLSGATVDYLDEDPLKTGFTVDNPNATSTCGCGHSFSAPSGA